MSYYNKWNTENFSKAMDTKFNGSVKVLGEYINIKTKILVQHTCGEKFLVTPDYLITSRKSTYCPSCYGNKKATHPEFLKKLSKVTTDFEVLGTYVNSDTAIKVKHSCGFITKMIPHVLLSGAGCIKCNGTKKYTLDEVVRLIEDEGNGNYSLEDTTYINNRTPLSIKHITCGHVFKTSLSHFVASKTRCSLCMRSSAGENYIYSYLQKSKYTFEYQKGFTSLGKKRFDFFIKDHNILIEFDGRQHFIPVDKFNGQKGFEKLQYSDSLKDNFVMDRPHLKLVRISFKAFKDIDTILDNISSTTIESIDNIAILSATTVVINGIYREIYE